MFWSLAQSFKRLKSLVSIRLQNKQPCVLVFSSQCYCTKEHISCQVFNCYLNFNNVVGLCVVFPLFKKLLRGMESWLSNTCYTIMKTGVQIPAPTSACSQPPDPEGLSILFWHLHKHACTCAHTHQSKLKHFLKINPAEGLHDTVSMGKPSLMG